MKTDPVIAEIRRTREAYAERFGGDVRAMLADIVERQRQGGREVVARSPKRITPTSIPHLASPGKRGI
jgi:hypothetical protein